MLSGLYSLSTLPLVVQDNILEYLDRRSLAFVSLTCRWLHRVAEKYLYRELEPLYQNYQVESNLRRNPALIAYIRSFESHDPSFLKWMWTQSPPSLAKLELRWAGNLETNAYSEFFDSIPPQSRVEALESGLNTPCATRMLTSLHAFDGLAFLKLRNDTMPSYNLQTILQVLHAPSLEILELENVTDWRIQWQKSFEDTIPNLRGLRLDIKGYEDDVMFGDEDDQWAEANMPPTDIKWDTVLTLYQRSIFFEISYPKYISNPFLNHAPSYASAHQLDPVPLIQWQVKCSQFFLAKDGTDDLYVHVGVRLVDLSTILSAIKSMDFGVRTIHLALDLPEDTTPSIAHLLHKSVRRLSITPPYGLLDPSVVPACIHSLPNLEYLSVHIDVTNEFQPLRRCTTATCSFRAVPGGQKISGLQLHFSRGMDSEWDIGVFDQPCGWYVDKYDPGDVVDFEMETREWFQLSTSMKSLSIWFYTTRFVYGQSF
jgi:hypothetical protein